MMNYEPSYSRCYKRKARPSNEEDDLGGGLDDGGGGSVGDPRAQFSAASSQGPFKTAKEKLILDTDKKNPQPYYQPQMKQPNAIYQPPAPAPVSHYQPPAPQYQQQPMYQPPPPQIQQPPQVPSMMNRPLYPSISNNNNNNNSSSNYSEVQQPPLRRGAVHGKYNLPLRQNSNSGQNGGGGGAGGLRGPSGGCCNCGKQNSEVSEQFPNLKNIEPKLIEIITNEVMDRTPPVTWKDIAGLRFVKKTIQEIVVWPMLRPDIFKGLRGPPKGLLLFGPPGTGKTLIAKCIANESQSTFFNISSSTLTSKWQGESEKLVRVLFEVARQCQPAVIFIDEIDSLLSQRSDEDRESSRRLKTEFFVQMDGASTSADERILLIGATNRPQELDDAARRRFVKRLYIPLPEKEGRRQIIENLMAKQGSELDDAELDDIADRTEGYSGADMTNLCREAALGPIRCLDTSTLSITTIDVDQIRPILHYDFLDAMQQVKASVSQSDLETYTKWNDSFGSVPIKPA